MEQHKCNPTILVVEDDEFVREVMVEILHKAGYGVLKAANAREALEVARSDNKIDLLLSDIVMPGMTGPDLGIEIRKLRPGIKLLFTSGYGETAVEANGLEADGEFYLPKPFSVGTLVGKVAQVVRSENRAAAAGA